MRTFNYEYESRKDAAKETIIYGMMWLFLAVLISGIPFLKNENNLVYNGISLLFLIIGIRKLIKGIRNLKQLLITHKSEDV
tara:strand:- start:2127 stop:2369 length:243 start_codon:yes stop_codon:yes gene_type:complete